MRGLWTAIDHAVTQIWQGTTPIFYENRVVEVVDPSSTPTSVDADSEAPDIVDGYLRLRLQETAPTSPVMGISPPRAGILGLYIAVPRGVGMDKADQHVAMLQTGLENRQIDRLWFGTMRVRAGAQRGPYWVVPAMVDYVFWPPSAE